MPTYEYVCKKCGDNFDVHQSFSDKPLKKHAECGGELQKVFHARGIVFKGGGFYATDSKASSSNSAPTKAEKSAESKPKPAKTEPKAEAKSTSTSTD